MASFYCLLTDCLVLLIFSCDSAAMDAMKDEEEELVYTLPSEWLTESCVPSNSDTHETVISPLFVITPTGVEVGQPFLDVSCCDSSACVCIT